MDLLAWLTIAADDPDPCAVLAVAADDLEEQGRIDEALYLRGEKFVTRPDWKVGDTVLIETQTLYYVGRVAEIGLGWTRLEEASWVHWTGRLSVLHRLRRFNDAGHGERRPRTEYVGTKYVYHDALVSHSPGPWELPGESVQ